MCIPFVSHFDIRWTDAFHQTQTPDTTGNTHMHLSNLTLDEVLGWVGARCCPDDCTYLPVFLCHSKQASFTLLNSCVGEGERGGSEREESYIESI